MIQGWWFWAPFSRPKSVEGPMPAYAGRCTPVRWVHLLLVVTIRNTIVEGSDPCGEASVCKYPRTWIIQRVALLPHFDVKGCRESCRSRLHRSSRSSPDGVLPTGSLPDATGASCQVSSASRWRRPGTEGKKKEPTKLKQPNEQKHPHPRPFRWSSPCSPFQSRHCWRWRQ